MDTLDTEVDRQVHAWRARIAEHAARLLALEALWDGDTEGWFLDIALVTTRDGREDVFVAEPIATLRYGGDIRLFNGQVPPWPEAVVARRAGEQLARELGIEFYFPSPDSPDDDCPHWWERDAAARCRNCGKPLAHDRGPYALPDQCVPCRQQDEWRHKLLADEPGHTGNRIVYCVLERDGRAARRLMLNLAYAPVAQLIAQLAAALRQQEAAAELSEQIDTLLAPEYVVALRAWCADEIDLRLRTYRRRGEIPEHFRGTVSRTWRGVEWSIDTQFDEPGRQIDALLSDHAFFDACADGRAVRVYGNGGVTHRDVAFLCRIGARGGSMLVSELREALPFLPASAIEETLAKLTRGGMITRNGDLIELLLKGQVIDVAGP